MNRTTKTGVALGAAATLAAAGIALAPAAAASSCAAGQELLFGSCQTATTVSEETRGGKPKPGTDGLAFRDARGNDLGSGMYENAHFITTGAEATVKGVHLIEVEQLKLPGTDGYGLLYKGYVKAQYADLDK